MDPRDEELTDEELTPHQRNLRARRRQKEAEALLTAYLETHACAPKDVMGCSICKPRSMAQWADWFERGRPRPKTVMDFSALRFLQRKDPS